MAIENRSEIFCENTYDVVIATRNRYDALKISIPLMLSEARQPRNMIIVDSSDNHNQIKELIHELTASWNGKTIVMNVTPPSSSHQRNVGLDYVTSDVVIFPDDDSIIIPGAFGSMMRIYDMDISNSVAGVCSAEAILPPEGLLNKNSYSLKIGDQFKKRVAKIKNLIERNIIPDALLMHGRNLIKKHEVPSWLNAENAVLVEYMTGFRMSFRTEIIKKYRFIEVFTGYCLAEDVGASFLALRDGLLIGAKNAQIYHHKYPARRANGYMFGLIHMINNAYVLSNSMEKKYILVYVAFYMQSIYKLSLYLLTPWSVYSRARIKGVIRGLWVAGRLFNAKGQHLDSIYKSEIKRAEKYKLE